MIRLIASDLDGTLLQNGSTAVSDEFLEMIPKLMEQGMALVPLKVYFKGSLCKMELGLCRGKKLYDKRQDIAKKDQKREAERDYKVKNLRA